MDNISNKTFKNKKNGQLYVVMHLAVECTNARCGNAFVVVYKHISNEDIIFARDFEEFIEKFEVVP